MRADSLGADLQRYLDGAQRKYDHRRQKRTTVYRQKDSHLTLIVKDRRAPTERHLAGNELEYVSYQDLEFIKQFMPRNGKGKA